MEINKWKSFFFLLHHCNYNHSCTYSVFKYVSLLHIYMKQKSNTRLVKIKLNSALELINERNKIVTLDSKFTVSKTKYNESRSFHFPLSFASPGNWIFHVLHGPASSFKSLLVQLRSWITSPKLH